MIHNDIDEALSLLAVADLSRADNAFLRAAKLLYELRDAREVLATKTHSQKIMLKILAERNKQDMQWGGPEHDDKHTPCEWMGFIERQLQRFQLSYESAFSEQTECVVLRDCLVKVAALAIAAWESAERRQKSEKP